MEQALTVAADRDGDWQPRGERLGAQARTELPRHGVVKGREDQSIFLCQQLGQLSSVRIGHDAGTGTTTLVVALTRAASSAAAVATASRGFTGGGLRPRTARAKVG